MFLRQVVLCIATCLHNAQRDWVLRQRLLHEQMDAWTSGLYWHPSFGTLPSTGLQALTTEDTWADLCVRCRSCNPHPDPIRQRFDLMAACRIILWGLGAPSSEGPQVAYGHQAAPTALMWCCCRLAMQPQPVPGVVEL